MLLAAGLHHADGVLDVGDAIMAHGSPDRRREVLETPASASAVSARSSWSTLLPWVPSPRCAPALRGARRSPCSPVRSRPGRRCSSCWPSAIPQIHAPPPCPLYEALSGPRRTPAVVVALLAPLPFLLATGALAPLAILAVPLVALGALRISAAKFGGIGGDVVGATGEVCRAALLVLLSTTV